MKTVKTQNAIGMLLAHDHTRIDGTQFKGVMFKKGHIVKEEDIPILLDMGKNYIYVLKLKKNMLHENKAALALAKLIAGNTVHLSVAQEGKVNLYATKRGLLHIDIKKLLHINKLDNIAVSTLHTGFMVEENALIASAKIIPLAIDKAILTDVEKKATQAIIQVKELPCSNVGLIVTGNEVYSKRIKDKFSPILVKKIEDLGSKIAECIFLPDNKKQIAEHIKEMSEKYDMVLISGGMSVDPDDVTSHAIRKISTKVVTYGTPVLPGAMFMLAYRHAVPLLGIPACGMFSKTTVLDVILPRILAREELSKKHIAALGHGGLCRVCPSCTFPQCSFAK